MRVEVCYFKLSELKSSGTHYYERVHRKVLTHLPEISRMKFNFILITIQAWEGYSVDGR